jgi:hypothetical protein
MLKLERKKFIWIVGSPRSGTTMLCNFIGNYTEAVFNEPWAKYPVRKPEEWQFPDGVRSLVFKYCCNWMDAQIISDRFKESKFIHILRNPSDILFSMMFPKADSYPPRSWDEYGNERDKRFAQAVDHWYTFVQGSFAIEDTLKDRYKLVIYEKLPEQLDDLSSFLKLPLKKENLPYKEGRNLPKEKLAHLEDLWSKHPQKLALRQEIEKKYY